MNHDSLPPSAFRVPSYGWLVLALASCGATLAPEHAPPAAVLTSAQLAPSACVPAPVAASDSAPAPVVPPPTATALAYSETARRILAASLASDGAFQKLGVLTDVIGSRLSGSAALEHAVTWAKDTFTAEAHERVTLEPVRVPHWVRGAESATVLAPLVRALPVLTLGGSVATPAQGIDADLVVVSSFDELEARKLEIPGKIVLFDHVMAGPANAGSGYGEAIPYRTTGASRAGALGAVAVLVRSLTAHSLGVPHTGSMRYLDSKAKKIPAAAVTVEDAELLHRLVERGQTVKLHLALSPKTLPDANSANVTAEIRGRELPDEVVLIGAHLDSWDVGQGAQDDGAGVVTVMQALTTLRGLGLVPRRTLRAVLFTNEENGVRGAAQYEKDHHAERHVGAFEMDTGAGAPLGFMTDGEQPFLGEAQETAALLAPIGAATVKPGFAGEDISALKPDKVPLFAVMLNIEHYFDVHHSAADTLDKIDPEQLKKSVAALATMAFVVADQARTWNDSVVNH